MPRKPSFSHALRQVREAVGKTQAEFARIVGCSSPTIRGIENGQRPVTQELAERIMDETGAWPFCLIENWEEACDLHGEPYTSVSFFRFKQGLDESAAKTSWKNVNRELEKVIEAAEKVGKSHLALYYISKGIAEVVRRLDLDDSLFRVYEEISIQISPKLTVRQMRDNPDLAKAVGFQDSPNLPDEAVFRSKLISGDAVERSPHQSRWDTMDVTSPWFVNRRPICGDLSEEARKIYGAESVKAKYQKRQGEKYKARMAAERPEQ